MDVYERLAAATAFKWDAGNLEKKRLSHQGTPAECEQVFFTQPLVVAADPAHSELEPRFFVLGQSDGGRPLFVVFTLRENLIRVISPRDMNRGERRACG
jgi:uncharacterized protein